MTNKPLFLLSAILLSAVFAVAQPTQRQNARSGLPNVVIIYADDIGYGDLSCYNPKNRVKTPNADRLAKQGLRFTDAHSTASTCTPSRYSLMTGEYAWRQRGTGILPGDAPALLKPGRQTLPAVFKAAGYRTGIVGKWHLGLGGERGPEWNRSAGAGQINPSPNEIGFDQSFIMAATGDRVPTVFIENGRVVGLDPNDPIAVSYKEKIGNEPTGKENPELLKMKHSHGHDNTIVNGVGRIGWMTGGKAARWVDEDMADRFTQKAVQFIENSKDKQFFLYFATHDIHVPRVPNARFAGKSGLGPRGDALLEFDWSVGEVLKTLDRLGLANNTLVILSSDNGCVIDDGYQDEAVTRLGDHNPRGPLRGGKGGILEAGNRVPFIVRYPGEVKPGVSNALMSQIDLMASFAAMTGQTIDKQTAPDTENHLSALLGKDKKGRDYLIEHASTFAVSDGTWKYIEPNNGVKVQVNTNTETGYSPEPQLYNLKTDLYESQNVATQHPNDVKRLQDYLTKTRGTNFYRAPKY